MKHIITLSILVLTGSLVWFAFVYYPKTLQNVQTGSSIPTNTVDKVSAYSEKFPIKTDKFKIVFEEEEDTYYVFVEGKNLMEFELNQKEAKASLMKAIEETRLCDFNVYYVSTSKLDLPERLTTDPECK